MNDFQCLILAVPLTIWALLTLWIWRENRGLWRDIEAYKQTQHQLAVTLNKYYEENRKLKGVSDGN